jgi:serine/threonine protein kinase
MPENHLNQALETSRYELVRLLGAGASGMVYLALDCEAGEHVALKKLSRMNPVSVLRFKREFRALANIHHRNLVQLYELEHAHDGWFLTMELVEGVELLHGLGTIQAPSEAATWDRGDARVARQEHDQARHSKLVDAFSQLAQAIHAIHQAGFLHRDLKPSNVMLEREGRVVVLDFGLVRELMPSCSFSPSPWRRWPPPLGTTWSECGARSDARSRSCLKHRPCRKCISRCACRTTSTAASTSSRRPLERSICRSIRR